jgi:tRNA G18 (ribose-2'-O)-methylase SpoU
MKERQSLQKMGTEGMERKNSRLAVICHNVRSAWNVGSIFRSADGVGVVKVYLTGYTPVPPHVGISKTALGAEVFVPWQKFSQIDSAIKKLREAGYEIVALEQDEKSVPLEKYKSRKNIALVLGNEVRGLSPAVLKKCDSIVEIPMHGEKESLNVSVAFGIAAYTIISSPFLKGDLPTGRHVKGDFISSRL